MGVYCHVQKCHFNLHDGRLMVNMKMTLKISNLNGMILHNLQAVCGANNFNKLFVPHYKRPWNNACV